MAEAIRTTITRKIITAAVVIVYKADGHSQVCGYIHSKFAGRFVQLLNFIILRYLLIDFPNFLYPFSFQKFSSKKSLFSGGNNRSNDNYRNYDQNQQRTDNYYNTGGGGGNTAGGGSKPRGGGGGGYHGGHQQGQDFNRRGGQSNYNRGGRR